jgi:soluble lytic murein transglycosylase-like protein
VAAYNAGEGRIFEFKGIPPFQETREYVDRVLNLFQGYKEVVG